MAELNAGLNIIEDAGRQLALCNACRYCEGLCPVFVAIETRRDFDQKDVFYLSNLCHDCRGCYYACMYTPPHEFAINIPQILSQARAQTYRRWSWPDFLGRAFKNRGITVFLALAAIVVVIALALVMIPQETLFTAHVGPGAFYEVVPYLAMVAGAMVLFFYGVAVWVRGGAKFWSETRSALEKPGSFKALLTAIGAALGLKYLKGGGPGCFYPDEKPSVGAPLLSLTYILGTDQRSHFDYAGVCVPGYFEDDAAVCVDERAGNIRRGWRCSAGDRYGRPDLLQNDEVIRNPARQKRVEWITCFS